MDTAEVVSDSSPVMPAILSVLPLFLLGCSVRLKSQRYFSCAPSTFSRLYLGVHYLGDVTVGAIVGFAIGTLFYFIMRRVQMRMGTVKLISEQFTSSGYMKADMDMFLSAVFFNYICIVVFSLTLGIR